MAEVVFSCEQRSRYSARRFANAPYLIVDHLSLVGVHRRPWIAWYNRDAPEWHDFIHALTCIIGIAPADIAGQRADSGGVLLGAPLSPLRRRAATVAA